MNTLVETLRQNYVEQGEPTSFLFHIPKDNPVDMLMSVSITLESQEVARGIIKEVAEIAQSFKGKSEEIIGETHVFTDTVNGVSMVYLVLADSDLYPVDCPSTAIYYLGSFDAYQSYPEPSLSAKAEVGRVSYNTQGEQFLNTMNAEIPLDLIMPQVNRTRPNEGNRESYEAALPNFFNKFPHLSTHLSSIGPFNYNGALDTADTFVGHEALINQGLDAASEVEISMVPVGESGWAVRLMTLDDSDFNRYYVGISLDEGFPQQSCELILPNNSEMPTLVRTSHAVPARIFEDKW